MLAIHAEDSLDDISREQWNALTDGKAFSQSYDWLRFVERDTAGVARYLLARRDGSLRGALPLYRLHSAHSPRYTQEHFASLLGVRAPALIAGGCRGYHTSFLLAGTAEERRVTLTALLAQACEEAAAAGRAVIFPCLTTQALAELAGIVPVRAAFDLAEAEIVGCGDGIEPYIGRLRSSRRRKVRAERAGFAAAGWRIRLLRLGECWPEVARLLANLQRRYGHQASLAALEGSLQSQARLLGDASVVFCCEDGQGPVGVAVYYPWRSTMFGILAGFDYGNLRGAYEYFNTCIYEPIGYAAVAGCSAVHLGVGSWEAKALRGAFLRPLWSAVAVCREGAGAPGVELANPEVVTEWTDRIRSMRFNMDAAEWAVPGGVPARA